MRGGRNKIYLMTKIAICTALICVSSYIVIPLPFTPVVLSMHTAAVNLTGLILKPRNAMLTVLLYLMLGLIGVPVFAGGTAGPAKLFGPTGGYYFGFLAAVAVISLINGENERFGRGMIASIAGIPVQHLFAVVFMCLWGDTNVSDAFLLVSLPFLPGDILKCIIASSAASRLKKTEHKIV